MKVGYARVSTDDQKLELQHDALSAHGCERIFEEKISAAGTDLPVRKQLLAYARRGDCIVVWKLDRLGRSLSDLVDLVTCLSKRGIDICSLRESIDTTTAAGRLTLHLFAALAEFEADLVRERTRAGLEAARRRGARLGRPASLSSAQLEMARSLMENPRLSARQIAAQLGVHRTTLYRSLQRLHGAQS